MNDESSKHPLLLNSISLHLLLSLFILIISFSPALAANSDKEIKVGAFPFKPIIFSDDKNITQGVNADLLNQIAEENDWVINYVHGSWQEGLDRAKDGKLDLITSVMFAEERAQYLDYSKEPIMTVWGGIYHLPKSGIDSVFDLQDKDVAIMKGDHSGKEFVKLIRKFDIGCNFVEVSSHADVFTLVQEKKVIAGVAPNVFGTLNASRYNLLASDIVFSPHPLYFAAPKGTNKDLLADIDNSLKLWKEEKNSYYYKTLDSWFSLQSKQPFTIPPLFFYIAGVGVCLVLLLLMWGRSLRSQVYIRTKKLSESEEKYRNLVEDTPDLITRVDAEGRITFANHATLNIYGLPPKECLGLMAFDFVHPEDQEVTKTSFNDWIQHCESEFAYENRLVSVDGQKTHHMAWTIHPEYNELGSVIGFTGSARDITERKQAEMKLLESNTINETLISTIPFPIDIVDSEGHVLFANDLMEEAIGKRVDGEHCWNLYKDDHQQCKGCPLKKPIKLGETKSLETTGVLGEKSFLIYHTGMIYMGQTALLEVFVDVTERKQAVENLRDSEERFRRLVENAPDAIYVRDNSCFAYLNDTAIQLFGADSNQDLIGTPVIDRYHPKVRDNIRARMRIINEERSAIPEYQSVCLKLDGTEVNVESTVVPITYQGNDGALVFMRDITDRIKDQKQHKQLEEQLHQSQKVESLGRLAGGVAHDYNNMLSVILGYSELAQMKVEQSSPIQRDLEQIHQAAIRSRDITRQLLAFARKQIINPKVLNLNDSVEKTLKMLRNLLGENISLTWQPKESLPLVKIDPSQLDQILANLCVNAKDAIADTGEMTIETGIASFDQEYCNDHSGFVPGEFVILSVNDDGCGMDSDTVDHIFDPFYTTKNIGEGTGLGLSTVYGIVKQSNGFINVYSEPDQGTTFEIYLPRCAEKGVLEQEPSISKFEKGHGEMVLLVEDEIAIVEMTTTMLKDIGYKVLAADSPAEALSLAKANQGEIDLLLTDVIMPGMNGRDLANQLKEMRPNLQVIFMSGYTADVIAHHGVLDEGINFIQKPFSQSDLSLCIKEILDSK